MKPLVYALVATVFYAINTVLLEQKFSKFDNLFLAACFSGIVAITLSAVIAVARPAATPISVEVAPALGLLLVSGLIYAAADYLYIGAYTNGGNLLAITCIAILLPAFASLIKLAVFRVPPNLLQIAGYLVVLLGVALVVKGTPQGHSTTP